MKVRPRNAARSQGCAGGDREVRVLAVDGARLILEDGPRRVVGPGESINLPDPTLEVEGVLTESDRAYLRAMRRLGLRKVFLSFVESEKSACETSSRFSVNPSTRRTEPSSAFCVLTPYW